MNSITSMFKRWPLTSLFALVYLFTWVPGLLFWKNAPAFITPTFLIGAGIAALSIVAIVDGRAGLKDFGRRLILWRVPPRWYLVVFGLPVLMVAGSVAITIFADGAALDWSKLPPPGQVALLLAVFSLLPIAAPLPEEIAWRGVALPWLLRVSSPLVASLVLGVVWSLWHLTVVLDNPALRPPVPFLLAVPSLSIITTWIFMNTRSSLFIAILFHAWYDVMLYCVVAVLPPEHNATLLWALGGLQGLLAVAIVAANPAHWLRRPDTAPVDATEARLAQ